MIAARLGQSGALLIALSSGDALAQYNNATANAAVAGAVAGTTAANYSARPEIPLPVVMGRELNDWVDPRVGTTARLAHGCGGITVQVALSGTSAFNFLNLLVLNESGHSVGLVDDQVIAEFASGLKRWMLTNDGGGAALQDGWQRQQWLRFPEKEDFENERSLVIHLPFESETGPCTMSVHFEMPPQAEPEQRTHLDYSALEIAFSGGTHFVANGGLKKLDPDLGAALDIGFYVYPAVNHGFTFEIGGDFYDKRAVRRVAPTMVLGERPRVTAAGLFIGYSARHYLLDWLSVSYNPAIGPVAFELTDDSKDGAKVSTGVFCIRQRLRLNARFAQISDGTEFHLAPSLLLFTAPYGTLGAVELQGNSLAAMLSFVVGG